MFPFHLVKFGNTEFLLMKTHRVLLNRSTKYVVVRYRKNQTILESFTKKNSLWNLKRLHGGLFEVEVLEIFTTTFFVQIVICTWIFFKYYRLLSLKRKNIFSKKDASHLKIAWHSKRQRKNIEKRERKTKNEKKSNNNNKKLYFVRKHIWHV